MSSIKLIVGLANPGSQYENTRHNAGAWFVEELARAFQISLKADSKYFGVTGRGVIAEQDVRLLIPTTYMNLSGKSVAPMLKFFKYAPEQMLVAHDELDFSPGEVRLKFDGGLGGHNGLKDIVAKLGNAKNFYRLRIGIGHPGNKSQVANYVLNKPSVIERDHIDRAVDDSVRVIGDIVNGRHDQAMQYLHSLKPSS